MKTFTKSTRRKKNGTNRQVCVWQNGLYSEGRAPANAYWWRINGNDMIATFFMIVALLRSIRWTRRTAQNLPALTAPPAPPSTSSSESANSSYSHQLLQHIREGDDDGDETPNTSTFSLLRSDRQCDESTQTPEPFSQQAMASSSTPSRSNSVSNGRSTGRLFSLGQSGHSIFSRSDSTATNTSSSGGGPAVAAAASIPIAGMSGGRPRRVDSTASTISTSVFSSEQQLAAAGDDRRSSEGGTRLNQQRRSSGRIRRYAPTKTTIVGARRRTTGRLAFIRYRSDNKPFDCGVCCAGVWTASVY